MPNNQKRINMTSLFFNLYAYLFVFTIILSEAVMWHYTYSYSIPEARVFKWVCLIMCLLGIIIMGGIHKKVLIGLGILTAYLGLYFFLTPTNELEFLTDFMIPFLLIFALICQFYCNNKLNYILNAYKNILFVIAAISLIFWIFGSLLQVMPGRAHTVYHWASANRNTYTYWGLYFENPVQATTILGSKIIRNTGICPEAPGYSSLVLYALLIELFSKDKKPFRIAVFVLTLLSTFSTKVVFFLLEIIILYYLMKNAKASLYKILKFFLVIFLLVAAVYIGYIVIIDKSATGSYMVRVDDLTAQINTWLNYPIFGCGFSYFEEILNNTSVSRSNNGLSMGLTVILAEGGIYLFAIYILPYILGYFKTKNTKLEKCFIIAAATSITDLFVSNIGHSYRFFVILSIGYAVFIFNEVENRSESIVPTEHKKKLHI